MRELFSDINHTAQRALRAMCGPFKGQRDKVRAYKAVFIPGGGLDHNSEVVMKDLRRFCGIDFTDHGSDGRLATRFEGRREVYNWIMQNIQYKDMFKLDQHINELEELYEDE